MNYVKVVYVSLIVTFRRQSICWYSVMGCQRLTSAVMAESRGTITEDTSLSRIADGETCGRRGEHIIGLQFRY